MRESDQFGFLIMVALLIIIIFAILALIAGNIVNQLFAPAPSIAGPLGAAAALGLFLFLLIRTLDAIAK